MSYRKTDVDGQVMWEDNEGRRLKNPDEKPDMYGWKAVHIEGRRMWESPEGERYDG
jgi:hypothetical protein